MDFHHSSNNILDTIAMIEKYRLDIRTVTMGISLLGCMRSATKDTCTAVYDTITRRAEHLVSECEKIERELGIPIVNKRISVTPVALIASREHELVAHALDEAAKAVGVNFIGGYSALVEKGMSESDSRLIASIPEALASTDVVCSSVNIGSSRAGINMSGVKRMGEIIRETADLTADTNGFGCAKLVVFANAVSDNPFMAGAFHGVQEADTTISVGVSGPGVVQRALQQVRGERFDACAEAIKRAAFKITRVGQLVGHLAAERLGVYFNIVDLSLAPTAEIGDSVAHILEEMGLETVGTHGTVAALALLNDAVKKGGLMACSHVGGLSGSFIPISEDAGMIDSAAAGHITLDKLEAMTAICSVGLDMVAVPGDTSAATLAAMIADEAAIGVMNHKTTAVRVIPAVGLGVGDTVEFGGLLGRAPIMPVHTPSSEAFIARCGRIPSPVHGFRN